MLCANTGVNVNDWPDFRCEKDIKVSYTVYTRLSLLLKSLLAITRVTPAYKLSRKQGHDYVILYRYAAYTCLCYSYLILLYTLSVISVDQVIYLALFLTGYTSVTCN